MDAVLRSAYFFVCALPLLAQSPIDDSYFARQLYPALEKSGCQNCHHANGVANSTRLRFPDSPTAEDITSFGKSLHLLLDRNRPENSLLLTKPTRRVAHAGGLKINPGSPEESALRTWLDYLKSHTQPTDRFLLSSQQPDRRPVLRRLTHAQYNNTIRDLLGDDTRIADQFPAEDFVGGYRNQFQSQSISPLLAEAYTHAAEKLARAAFRNGDQQHLIPCKSSEPNCRTHFLKTFGARAFRRPLLPAELARYDKLFLSQKSFLAGAQLVVEAMLQSPNFLLRTENGADPSLRAYESASRLSYALWNTMPDAELFRAATQGELGTPTGFQKQARRLLADPRAHAALDQFLAEWLRFDQLLDAVKDRGSFPTYSPDLTVAMIEETRRLAADLIWQDKNFMQFFSADYTFLNAALANLYQLPAPPSDYAKITLPPATGRAGILGQATYLASTSKPSDTSPTQRGLFVREHFLCQEVPQPPPGVNANLPNLDPAKPQTTRERLALHLNNESCASCHTLVDPIGLALEHYDAIGQYRDKQRLTFRPLHGESKEPRRVDLAIDASGYVAGLANSQFTTPRELGQILAAAPQCQLCIAKQLFRYYTGRHESPRDSAILERAYASFRQSNFQFRTLMLSLLEAITLPPEPTAK